MKGVTIFKDEISNKKILQVDIKEIAKHPDEFEDLIDVLIAEARRNDKKIPWQDAKKRLKKAGR
jgi:hypothetical protein